jgi:hypothetical protein
LGANNQKGEYDFRRYFLETAADAPQSVVTSHLERIGQLGESLGYEGDINRYCPCWLDSAQADIALRSKRTKDLLKASLHAVSKAFFSCGDPLHIWRAFEYLELASQFLSPGVAAFIALCLVYKIDRAQPLDFLFQCCYEIFKPGLDIRDYQSKNVWKFDKASINDVTILSGLPSVFIMKTLFCLWNDAVMLANFTSILTGADVNEEIIKEMRRVETEELGKHLKVSMVT